MVIVVAGFLVGTISMLIIAADSSFFLLLRSFWEEFILFLYDLFGQNGLIMGLELILLSLSQSACGILRSTPRPASDTCSTGEEL